MTVKARHFNFDTLSTFFEGEGAGGGTGTGAGAGGQGGGGAPPPAALTFAHMPEAVRDTILAKGYSSDREKHTIDQVGFDKIVNSYYQANRALGGARDVVAIPGETATEADWTKFQESFRPKDVSAYGDLGIAKDTPIDGGFVDFAKGWFRDIGIPPALAPKAAAGYMKYAAERQAAERAEGDAAIATIKQERGATFDQDLARGQQVAKAMKLDIGVLNDLEKALGGGGKGAAGIMKLFLGLGAAMQEGSFKVEGAGGSGAGGGELTPEQADAEINKLYGDEAFMKKYSNANDPGHAQATKQMEALFAKKHGKKAA